MSLIFLIQSSVDLRIYSTFCCKLAPLKFEWITAFIAFRAVARRGDTVKAFLPSKPEMSLVMKHTETVSVDLSGPFFSTAVFRFVRQSSSSTLRDYLVVENAERDPKMPKKHWEGLL